MYAFPLFMLHVQYLYIHDLITLIQ